MRSISTASQFQPLKNDHSKSGHFCSDFKRFLTKLQPFIWISNPWVSGFQISFQIHTICKPTSFRPFEIGTCLDFRSLLYCINFQLVDNISVMRPFCLVESRCGRALRLPHNYSVLPSSVVH